MNETIFHIEILTDNDNLEEYLFGKLNNNLLDLGKGISVLKELCDNNQLKMKITIDKQKTISYDDSLRITLLSNIIASWLVYKLTGKKITLMINNNSVPLKKNSLKNYFEKIFED
jgi:hypothetical protein